jgi:hypothetical protein
MIGCYFCVVLMEGFSLAEQIKQETSEIPVQMPEKVVKKPRKPRTPEQKIGRQKYHEVIGKETLEKVDLILLKLRHMEHYLRSLGKSDVGMPLLQKYATRDQVDLEIMDLVHQAGNLGVFPKDVAKSLQQYKLEYYAVSRRMVRMNKRLMLETGELLFEKRGHKWALTRFAFDVYGATDLEDARSIILETSEEAEDTV